MTATPSSRPRLIWDLDDTLLPLMQGWRDWASALPQATAFPPYSGLLENPPLQVCGLSRQAYLDSLDAYRLGPLAASSTPYPELTPWFIEHGDKFEHHVLTARPRSTVAAGASWVFNHFSRWVRHFHFVPATRPGDLAPDQGASKALIVAEIGPAFCMLDDSPANLADCQAFVKHTLLVPQPWNDQRLSYQQLLTQIPIPNR